ncbi:MAG TPA: MFS transporter [Propionibacteriaceae bacterium]|nr:MFS transporter [Propionibacteriaceae bacterium]
MSSRHGRRRSELNRPLALLVAGTFFMENLDGTIIATAAPAMAADLGVAAVDINIAITAYLVTIAIGIPVSGWLTDRFGGRRILLIAIVTFTLASVLCAISSSLAMLVGARILQGIGGAMMVPVGRLVVLRATSKKDLLDATAYLTWPALVAPVIAPALGGWIVSVASWPWIFLINVPLGMVAIVIAARIVPREALRSVGPLDWVGFILSAVFLLSLLVGVELLGSARVPALGMVVGAVAVTILALLTGAWFRHAAHPLLRFGALRKPSFRVSNVGGSVYRLVISAAPFLLPLMFQVGFGWSPVLAGTLVLMLFLGNVGIKPATSPVIRRFGFRAVLIASIAGGAVVFALIATLSASSPLPLVMGLLLLSGVFRSVGFSAYNSLQFADIEPAQMSYASTLSSTMQQVAGALGIAVGAVVVRVADRILGPSALPAWPYLVAFVVLALLMIWPLVEAIRLHRGAGDEVAARK